MKPKLLPAVAAGLLCSVQAHAVAVTLDFEGATSFAQLDNFYNGGTDSAGASGLNVGVSFGGDALALINDALGPYFSNAPTPVTVMNPVGPSSALNAPAGFDGTASFYYSASSDTSVGIYAGLDGTGALLGTFSLTANAQNGCSDAPYCHWDLVSLPFAGIAQSIQFGEAANVAGFDNVTINTVPVPAAAWLTLSGIGVLAPRLRRRRGA